MARRGKFYRKNEREVMESLGFKPTQNSGSGWIEKEDGENDHILAQLKSTDGMSVGVGLNDIKVLESNASIAHKAPLFVIQFLKTNEVFLIMRPEDVGTIASYVNTGFCDIQEPIITTSLDTTKSKAIKKPVITSGDRDAFWKEKEEERKKWQKKQKRS